MLQQFIAWAQAIPNAQVTMAVPSDNRSARVDVDLPRAMGRVTCWETGDYHAEVLDIETCGTIYSDNGTLDSATPMQQKFVPFLKAMGFQ